MTDVTEQEAPQPTPEEKLAAAKADLAAAGKVSSEAISDDDFAAAKASRTAALQAEKAAVDARSADPDSQFDSEYEARMAAECEAAAEFAESQGRMDEAADLYRNATIHRSQAQRGLPTLRAKRAAEQAARLADPAGPADLADSPARPGR